jgi:hypothetical protein
LTLVTARIWEIISLSAGRPRFSTGSPGARG